MIQPSLRRSARLERRNIQGKEAAKLFYERKRVVDHKCKPPCFVVSAPGKVIVSGEHAVVYGNNAIAAAITLRTRVLAVQSPRSCRTITLRFSDLDAHMSWDIDTLPWQVFARPIKMEASEEIVRTIDSERIKAIQPFALPRLETVPQEARELIRSTSLAFLYIFMSIASKDSTCYSYCIESSIPIAVGLGSSASICVCFAAAILLQGGLVHFPNQLVCAKQRQRCLDVINRWAFVGELCIHGNPSGIDNTISVSGKALLFRRDVSTGLPTIEPLPHLPELPIILVDTRQPRSSFIELQKVANLRESHPIVVAALFQTVEAVTADVLRLIQTPAMSPHKFPGYIHKLGTLFRMNHSLLAALGVSHPSLERVCEIVTNADAGYVKLTGSGGGGCAIVLLNPERIDTMKECSSPSNSAFEAIKRGLELNDFSVYQTSIGGPGVGVKQLDIGTHGFVPGAHLNCGYSTGLESLHNAGRHDGWLFWN